MGAISAGIVVFVPFPFSDLSQTKIRPALCMAPAGRDDWILCQITSKAYGDATAVKIESTDFMVGSLNQMSFVRPGKLFTAHSRIVVRIVGALQPPILTNIVDVVVKMLKP